MEKRDKDEYRSRIWLYASDPATRESFDEQDRTRALWGLYTNPGLVAFVRGDHTKAVQLWRPLAQNGDAEAQTDLGDMYREGLGVSQDYAEAAILYRRAADQGENLAQMLLGRLYAAGQGVAQDYVQGHVWLNLAASRISNGEVRDATVKERDDLASKMTPDQIAEAQRMAREWKPTKR